MYGELPFQAAYAALVTEFCNLNYTKNDLIKLYASYNITGRLEHFLKLSFVLCSQQFYTGEKKS